MPGDCFTSVFHSFVSTSSCKGTITRSFATGSHYKETDSDCKGNASCFFATNSDSKRTKDRCKRIDSCSFATELQFKETGSDCKAMPARYKGTRLKNKVILMSFLHYSAEFFRLLIREGKISRLAKSLSFRGLRVPANLCNRPLGQF
jgi:hypothetical protein